jgi:hypothetical protein
MKFIDNQLLACLNDHGRVDRVGGVGEGCMGRLSAFQSFL